MTDHPSLTIGIEEEYLVVDRETRDLVQDPDDAFLKAAAEAAGEDKVTPEFLRCQIEVGTRPCETIGEARVDLARMRTGLCDAADANGYAIIAASTHPFARWRDQRRTDKERYEGLQQDLGLAVRRLLICGCHVHIGIEPEDLRVDLMTQAAYFLPHILALSTSSPYWEGEDSNLASYRLTVFDALPRTGLPDPLDSFNQYRRLVGALTDAGCIEDGTKIWWDIRPSWKFPTVEMRVADVCTRVDDAACIAAIYQCLMSYLYTLRRQNQRWRVYPNTLIAENRWRAQRYGETGELIDLGRGQLAAMADLIEELVELLKPEAERLGCVRELLHARRIVAEGTSATRQRAAFAEAKANGADDEDALRAVVDLLIAETRPDPKT